MYMHFCKNCIKHVGNTHVFVAQEDDGLPLESCEFIGVLSLKLVGKLDEVTMMALTKVIGAQVRQRILDLDVVDADLALLHHEKVSQCNVLCARTVGVVAGDVERRLVVNVHRHAAKALIEAQLQHHVGAENHLLHVDCAVSPCSPTLKLIGGLASIMMYDDVDLPLSGLLPQLASEKTASLKPSCI